jgi:thioredoxin-dependent peroxiredoxin
MRLNIPQPIYPTALRLRCIDDDVNGSLRVARMVRSVMRTAAPGFHPGCTRFSCPIQTMKKIAPLARDTGKVLPIVTATSSRLASLRTWAYMVAPESDGRSCPDQRRRAMALAINDTAPDFEAETTEGKIRFHEWLGDSWGVLFSHPKDFTPICTTELGYMARIKPEFDKRRVKIIGISVDPIDRHAKWAEDIKETQGFAPNYPMIGDPDLRIAKAWGMLPAAASGDARARTAADNQTVRNVFVVGPDKKIKLILVYPMTTGRNFDEVLRVIDSLQLTAKHKVATPVNWKQGEDVVIAGSVTDEEAKKQYPNGWKAPRPYLRIVPQPR